MKDVLRKTTIVESSVKNKTHVLKKFRFSGQSEREISSMNWVKFFLPGGK